MRIAERYRLERPLGEGGMAGVFLAVDEVTGTEVAVKQLHPELDAHPEVKARFLREARIVARLTHPHVVAIHDVQPVEETGGIALVMEYIEGRDLKSVIKRRPPLVMCPELAAQMIRPVAKALEYVHGQGIIHRDIKPANVLVGTNGAVKLTDFGIARGDDDQGLTRTGDFLGTPAYIPPEQARGLRVTTAADQYALGVMLYQLATGEKPFAARSTAEIVLAILRAEYPDPRTRNPAIDDAMAAVINRAMASEPTDRYPDVTAFIAALDACVPPSPDTLPTIVAGLVSAPRRTSETFAVTIADRLAAEGNVALEMGDRRTAAEKARSALFRVANHRPSHRILGALGEAPPDPTAIPEIDAVTGDDRTEFDPRPPGAFDDQTELGASIGDPMPEVGVGSVTGIGVDDTDPPIVATPLAPEPDPPLPAEPETNRPAQPAADEVTVLRTADRPTGVAGWKILAVVFVFIALIGGGITWVVHSQPPTPPAMPSP